MYLSLRYLALFTLELAGLPLCESRTAGSKSLQVPFNDNPLSAGHSVHEA